MFQCDFTDVTGWTATGGTNWGIYQSNYAGGTAPELEFNWSPSTVALQRYISPEINTTGYTSLNLTFMSCINHYSGDYSLSIETTSDGGTTWNTVWTHEPATMPSSFIPVAISNGDIGSANFQLAFVFDGDSYNINYWYNDDVVLSDDPIPGTLTGTVILIPPIVPVTGVTIDVDGQQIHPNDDGVYFILLDAGTYVVTASLDPYIPVTESVEIFSGQTTIQNFTLSAGGLGTLEGTITLDGGTGYLPGVTVMLGQQAIQPDASGYYTINYLPGEYNVTAFLDGYKTASAVEVSILANQVTTIDITLEEGVYNIGEVVNNIGFDSFTYDASGNPVFETTDIYREVDNGNTVIMLFHEETGGG